MDLVDTLKAMLGLAPEASDEEVLAAFAAKMSGEAPPGAPPGDAPPPTDDLSAAPEGVPGETEEQRGLRLAASAGHSALATLSRKLDAQEKRVTALSAAARKDRVAAMVTANRTRIPETLVPWASTQDPDALAAWLRHAPEVYPSGDPTPAGRGAVAGTALLSKRDGRLTELCAGDPARVAKIRARDAARKANASDPLDG